MAIIERAFGGTVSIPVHPNEDRRVRAAHVARRAGDYGATIPARSPLT